ncbi:hypothetical protein X976_4434 [Burkholderia pseudomallei MSHR7500]|nr:hypothetical protein DO63_5026 [Burkholderia pseudomallei]KGD10482.1 hypothetical protein DP42_5415 [Burkholderia pseudomallei]KGS87270.1 hypothetical protein X976_4434 [Burkholderia pseudomallei MSHR7500]
MKSNACHLPFRLIPAPSPERRTHGAHSVDRFGQWERCARAGHPRIITGSNQRRRGSRRYEYRAIATERHGAGAPSRGNPKLKNSFRGNVRKRPYVNRPQCARSRTSCEWGVLFPDHSQRGGDKFRQSPIRIVAANLPL